MSNVHLPTNDLPLHEQVAAGIRRAMAEGRYAVGATLPSAKDLGETLGVHPNTVLRAYRLLRDEGLIDLRRSRGATVLGSPDLKRLDALADALLDEAARLHISVGALLGHIGSRAAQRR